MHTLMMNDVDPNKLVDFLRSNFGQHGTKVWDNDDTIDAVFYHQQYLAPSYSIHLVSILMEFDVRSRVATCIIYAGDARNKKHDTMSTEEIEHHIGDVVKSELGADAKVIGNMRYCAKCGTWDTYNIKQGQYTVICRSCGLEISLEEN